MRLHTEGNFEGFGMDTITLAGPLEAKLKANDLVGHPGGLDAAVQAVKDSGLRGTGFQVLRDFEGLSGHLHQYKVDIAKTMALPNAMESFPTLAHPLANKVGWFNLNNIACGLLGMPLGFLVIYVVSLMGKEPSAEMQAYVDEIRKPRGRTVLEEKTS